MKVAFIHPTSPKYKGTGATYSATQLAQALGEQHEVCVYTLQPTDSESQTGFSFTTKPLWTKENPFTHFPSQATKAVRRRLGEFGDFDLVHSYAMECFPAIAYIAEQNIAKTVLTLNAYLPVCPKNDLRYLGKEQCKRNGPIRCTSCIMQSHGRRRASGVKIPLQRETRLIMNQLRSTKLIQRSKDKYDSIDAYSALAAHMKESYEEFDFPVEKMHVIPIPLDEAFDRPHTSDFHEPFKLLFVGNLRPEKGVEWLPEIVDRLNSRSSAAFRLTIAGRGSMSRELIEGIHSRGIEEYVDFKGFVPNELLPELYAEHDLFVYPGRWREPLGRTFVEAFGTGTPIIATDVGGNTETIGDAGVTTEPTIEDIVESILSISKPEKLRAYSKEAHRNAERYRPEKIVEQHEILYQSVRCRNS